MTGVEDRIGSTTAGTGGRRAAFVRGKAILAVLGLALALLAAVALPEEASAHGSGYYGVHNHGQLQCGNYGQITVTGMYAGAYNGMVYGHQNSYDDVHYRAHLYRWNGSTWVYATSTRWFVKNVSIYGAELPSPNFTVPRGYWKVSTELLWYEGAGIGYLGSSPNAGAQGTCTYG